MIVATVLVEVLEIRTGEEKIHDLLKAIQLGWLEFLFGDCSIFLITVLTIERWFAVVRPIQYRYKFHRKRVYIYIMTIIIATLSINIHFLLPGYDPKNTRSKILVFIDDVLTLMVPLFVTWASYIHLWQHFKKAPAIQQSNGTKMKQKLVRMCAITAMFITVCWTPTEAYYHLTAFGLTLTVPRNIKICNTVAMSNSIVNPWIYYFTNKEYKKAFIRLFKDIVFPIEDMVKCCRSDSLAVTVTRVESPQGNGRADAATVMHFTNFSLDNESLNSKH